MMVRKIMVLLALMIGLGVTADAQSWRKLKDQAETLYEQGNYAEAARIYEQAYSKKKKKEELIFQAGEAWYLVRNYRKAADAYEKVKDKSDDYPLVGLKYARSLKQDGQYDRAIRAFREFSDAYTGEGRAILEDIIQTEIDGCELAQRISGQVESGLKFEHINTGINTDDNEFAPIAFDDNILHYSSDMGGEVRIYRAERSGEKWGKGQTPEGFPVIANGQYCHGSLTPDGSRFYFTICEEGTFGNLTTRCEIFVIQRQGNLWGQPERLPDFINQQGITATHPNVVHRGDVEILYFASNRGGGRGGMDVWYATRSLRLAGSSFSQPVNLGPTINTLGDEMSPYFDSAEGRLYFASNGHVSIGGFDIFSANGDLMNWTTPENIGVPYNSSADDYYFVKNASNSGGYLTSNRVYAGEKLTTTNDDIFAFGNKSKSISLQGNVFDQQTGEPLRNYTVTLFEILPEGSENSLITQTFEGEDGYSFEILPNRQFKVEVTSPGYQPGSYDFMTTDPNALAYGQPLFLSQGAYRPEQPVNEEGYPYTDQPTYTDETYPPAETQPYTPPVTEQPTAIDDYGTTYTARGTSDKDNYEYTSSSPRYDGVYYKVQISAIRNFDEYSPKYDGVRNIGNLHSEFLTARGLHRVLIGSFFSESEARNALASAKSSGYSTAFVVKYENGQRYGRINL